MEIVRPILFLDIDGVLNSHQHMGEKFEDIKNSVENWHELSDEEKYEVHAKSQIYKDLVDHVNAVYAATKCLFVLSSSWRNHFPLWKVQGMLGQKGFEGTLIGCTGRVFSGHRGREIGNWLEELFPTTKRHDLRYAIVDDDADMGIHEDRLVRTDTRIGITAEDVKKLIQMLGREFLQCPECKGAGSLDIERGGSWIECHICDGSGCV